MNIIIKKCKQIKRLFDKYTILRELILYGIIGATTASIDSAAFIFLNNFGANKYIANFISINIGIALSFILNTYLNFKITDKLIKRALSFFSVGYTGMLVSMLILYIGNDILGISIVVVKLISVVLVAIFQFVLNKLITYKKGK